MNEVISDEKLIADFMGDETRTLYSAHDNEGEFIQSNWDIDTLKRGIDSDYVNKIKEKKIYPDYKSDWNKLMRVKEKLNDIGFKIGVPDWKIPPHNLFFSHYTYYPKAGEMFELSGVSTEETRIISVYKSVLKSIQYLKGETK